jgi:flagellar basal-body rod modification protein FlgD
MMAFTSIDASAAVGATQTNGMSQADFIKILMTQMTYQDPLKPMDNEQFMAQMAQFTALQQTSDLNANLVQLIQNQAARRSACLAEAWTSRRLPAPRPALSKACPTTATCQ